MAYIKRSVSWEESNDLVLDARLAAGQLPHRTGFRLRSSEHASRRRVSVPHHLRSQLDRDVGGHRQGTRAIDRAGVDGSFSRRGGEPDGRRWLYGAYPWRL